MRRLLGGLRCFNSFKLFSGGVDGALFDGARWCNNVPWLLDVRLCGARLSDGHVR